VDLGERHTFREIKRPVAVMWKNDGDESDKAKAGRYAKSEGYTVFCYTAEADPLSKARHDIAR
jgi:hypothetical protein